MLSRRALLAASLVPGAALAQAPRAVRIGQATPAVSFLPLQAARAFGTFAPAGVTLDWAAMPGGDPACLAALDTNDIDMAAVGSETLLAAVAKGQPVQVVAALMSKVSLELVISNPLIERTAIAPADDPLAKRLAALRFATIGVSAMGGTQDRAARWLARQAGLDPKTEIKVTVAGPPPAIQAALEAGRIDAYILSPPEGLITEDARTGEVLIRMNDEFPALHGVPSLVLAVKTPVSPETRALVVATCRALQAACTQLLADPAAAAVKIQAALYPHIKPQVMQSAIASLKGGIETRGRLDEAGIAALLAYTADAVPGLDAHAPFWTNEYWDEAARSPPSSPGR